ncbi:MULTISPECIES: copper-containing nitrite reductase [unclassified Methylophaga]|jgi:nitrite reductase (NO-forming)|uniref:copper-containing nitrite reductase n=1 Tax=unclassified Methylophaga TaxID=2629249 RepID=UPI000C8DFDA6|nr:MULTISPECIES: copper-containing nitrite reductase [unclassified Methylophaga]MAK65491.1 nitrite reductase, copper-containing [Methylophaga sp.]MAY16214.1 nitrite reductase, copper-containing [Methylophaga sp.]HAO25903.1 nitrite reductase, copper-containing [Methylophaga sp.]|tara:strand:- start:1618 stop:2928 length:1311 start_codon:yes stop_codon:yes gene_type:complete
MNLHRLSNILVITVITALVLSLIVILALGGFSLLTYLKTTLIQMYGFVIAATASLFFFMRLIHQMHSRAFVISMVIFIVGIALFLSVSIGRMYMFQYPMYVESYGPGKGPGLPLNNVLTFFRHIGQFEWIEDIAHDPNNVPEPIASEANGQGNVTKVTLETKEVLAELAPGITFNYWTFNGTVPGPMIRVKEGDTVELTLHNHISSLHQHNIDLHAVTGPGGGGEATIVEPGESKTIRFKTLNPGLFVYHCAVPNMAVHMAHGMYGLILVEPKDGLPPVDKEFYLMQGEIYTTGAIGRKGLQVFDARKMLDSQPEYVVFNGRTGALIDNMQVKAGETVRLYIGNGGVAMNSSFHLVGEIFDTVYPEASMNGAQFKNVQTTNIPAGGATIVEFKVDYPGHYVLVDHALMRTDKGAWGVIEVIGDKDPSIFEEIESTL